MKKKKKNNKSINFFTLFIFSLYSFFILGLFFHTSAHPQLFGKYTVKYFLILLALIFFLPMLFILLRRLSKRIARKSFIILLISFFLLGLAVPEAFLRTKYSDYESTNYTATIDNFHPFLQAQLTPSNITESSDLHINSLGFRGEEIQQKKPNETFRIVILGGSTVLNREVTFEKNAARLLEKKLRNFYPHKKIEVINAGKDGYTSEHALIQYMFKIRDLDPDLVIMWHGINDMWASCIRDGVTTHGPYRSDYAHLLGPTANIVFNYFRPQPLIQIELVSIDFLLKALSDNLYSDFTLKIEEWKQNNLVKGYMQNHNTIYVREFPSINPYRRNLLYLIDLMKKDNVPLLLGNQANAFIEDPSADYFKHFLFPNAICFKDGKHYAYESIYHGMNLFNATTKKIAEENNVSFINFEREVPKNFTYFFDAVHYTEKGNEIIAQKLFEKITEEQIIR